MFIYLLEYFIFLYIGHYVAWIRDNVVRKTNCLSTHPNWMGERQETLKNLKMRDIFLPGTHDSAAYAKHKNSQLELIIEKYTITQVIIYPLKKKIVFIRFFNLFCIIIFFCSLYYETQIPILKYDLLM